MARVTRKPGPGIKQLKALNDFSQLEGKVGWFASARYPDGTPIAYVAAIHEFGYPKGNIPPRLGMRTTAAEKQPEWRATALKVAKGVLSGATTPTGAMDVMGAKAAGDIRKHIAGPIQPPLKPDTVKARLAGKKQGRVVAITIAHPLTATRALIGHLTNITVHK